MSAGEDVVFTITVTNTGNEPLENLVVSDALLGGNITAAFNIPNPFPVGDSASADFTYTPGADEDPVENSVTASGDGVDSGVYGHRSDTCDTEIPLNASIDVTKSCTPLAHVGDTVTYTITVTNTGDELNRPTSPSSTPSSATSRRPSRTTWRSVRPNRMTSITSCSRVTPTPW